MYVVVAQKLEHLLTGLFTFVCLSLFCIVAQAQSLGGAGKDVFGTATPEFLPVEEAYQLLLRVDEERNALLLDWTIEPGYYLYQHGFDASLTVRSSQAPVQPFSLDLVLPQGIAKTDEYFGDVEVFYHSVAAEASVAEGNSGVLSIASQGCADAGLCYPPQTEHFLYDALNKSVRALSASEASTLLSNDGAASIASTISGPAATSANAPPQTASAPPSFQLMALFAFVGGMVLNLFPCVFPVLALKVFGLVNAQAQSSQARRAHAWSYTAGIVCSFLLLAAVLIALRAGGEALGWGFQLQMPWLVALLAYLFFFLGLAMAGYLELGAGLAGIGQGLTEGGGHKASFFTGVLAVVVASPCTAPFMGAALGFALVQPAPLALLIFAALGLGMALPFLLLVFVPGLAGLLPRPGQWMQTFRELMAFPLFLTAVWLLWVIGRQLGPTGMALVVAGAVALFFALWCWRKQTLLWRGLALAALVVTAAFLLNSESGLRSAPMAKASKVASSSSALSLGDASYSAERVQALREAGQPVFVNLTADWCITCLANERLALSTDAVQQALSQNNVAYLKGDWTNSDPLITELLNEYGRSGVPLYLLFPSDLSQPAQILPQVLTKNLLVTALSSAQ